MRATRQTAATLKKVAIGAGFVTASYLAAALVNASPITQPDVTRAHPRSRVVVVDPVAPSANVHVEPAPARPEIEIVPTRTIHSL
ncbi:MAG: hypothetical protein ACRD26_20890 [Vicinamibacterales bacterium]